MECWDTIADYGFRSIGYGERILPKTDFTLCQHFVLIGSGLIWNVYFGVLALASGFFLATAVAVCKAHDNPWLRTPAALFIFLFRGSPLFIQFFFALAAFRLLNQAGVMQWLLPAQVGALLVLFLNTSAYSGEIFYGALRSVPKGDLEAADAYGLSGWAKFRRVTWPTMLRLAWPSYTNEAIFLFQATTLVFLAFPVWQQGGDALYYANYFADKTFNPFVPYPIIGFYFILLSLTVIGLFGIANRRLNRHLPQERKVRLKYRPQIIR